MHVRWLRAALENLNAEAEYSARDNPDAAKRIVARISEAVLNLATYPALGRPGRVSGTRELVVPGTPYIIPYQVRGDEIEIVRIFHAARRWPKKF